MRQRLHDNSIGGNDISYLLKAADVHQGTDRMVDRDKALWALNDAECIAKMKDTWTSIKTTRTVLANNKDAYNTTDVPKRRKSYIPDPSPAPKKEEDDIPTSYMPYADMDKVSSIYLKNQETFYGDDEVDDDRDILEFLVKKYGKEDVLKFIQINEERKDNRK